MKKIGMLIGLGLLVTMLSSPVYPLSYQIDFNGEGGYDTSWDMSVGDRIRVAIWLDDYTCLPDDKLLGVQLYVQFDSNKLQTVEAFPNDVMHGGPFDRSLSGFLERKPGIYNLTASHFDYVRVSRDRILIGTIMLEAISSGNTTIKAANKLGIDEFNDGFVADCSADNLGNPSPQSLYPDDAVATINLTGGSGDEDDDDGGSGRNERGYSDDYGGEAIPFDANEGSATGPGAVSTDADRAGPLSNRPLTTIPESFEEEPFDADRKSPAGNRTRNDSSPQQKKTGGAERRSETIDQGAPQPTTTIQQPTSPYRILITPSALTVDPGSVSRLNAKTLLQGKEVEGTYDWKIVPASSIGSTIDKNGQFVAGTNAVGFNVEETIRVTDTRNSTDAETVVTITPQAQAADDCQLAINPASVTLYPGETFVFTGRALGEKCREGEYEWRVNTRIGSDITADGTYRAGRNSIGKETIDIVIVEDAVNGTTAQSLVTVLLPEEAGSLGAESMQQPGKEDPAGRKIFPGVFLLVLVSVVAVVAGIVLFNKIKRR